MCSKKRTGLSFILSAPAGTGKTTLVDRLVEEFPHIVKNISYTTRRKRDGEVDGKDYLFLTKEDFLKKEDDFLEVVELFGNKYATSKSLVQNNQANSLHTVFVIDVEGALQLKKQIPCISIFVSPPSLNALTSRLKKRSSENPEEMAVRIKRAKKELEMVKYYDYHIVNDVLSTAYEALKSIVIAEEHRVTD